MTQNEKKNKKQKKKEYGEKYSVERDARAVCREILQYQGKTIVLYFVLLWTLKKLFSDLMYD